MTGYMHDDEGFASHKLDWAPGQEGKGFLIQPTETGIHHWPYLKDARPIVWTWPTQEMKPFHDQKKAESISAKPQGMDAEHRTYFHITPQGEVWSYGPGNRWLEPDEQAAIMDADPRLTMRDKAPEVESDGYGHANRLLEILGGFKRGRWMEIPRRWKERRESKTSGSDWFCPAYGIPDDVKEQIHEWGKTLPWDSSAKIQDPNKYHITSFYSPSGYADPTLHQWVQSESGASYPAYTHSLDAFSGQDKDLSPIVMRFHAPELSAHAEGMMDEAERRGLSPARFEGHKPHITLGHNPEGFPHQPPHIEFMTDPLHELHSYYDSLKR